MKFKTIFVITIFFVILVLIDSQVLEIDEVTCGSAVKITHCSTNYKLHSHSIAYGSGSGQQSVTGLPHADDPESLWIVKGAYGGESCPRGEPIKCGSTIRLKHSGTSRFLHSHYHSSPISHQQEVSAFDGLDTGDNWKLICLDKSSTYWLREQKVQLVHAETSSYLSASEEFMYNQPISGQIEIAAGRKTGKNTEWVAQEGIYFADRNFNNNNNNNNSN